MTCYKSGRLLEPCELEIAFDAVIASASEPCQGEKHLAALTAGERVPWAKVSCGSCTGSRIVLGVNVFALRITSLFIFEVFVNETVFVAIESCPFSSSGADGVFFEWR